MGALSPALASQHKSQSSHPRLGAAEAAKCQQDSQCQPGSPETTFRRCCLSEKRWHFHSDILSLGNRKQTTPLWAHVCVPCGRPGCIHTGFHCPHKVLHLPLQKKRRFHMPLSANCTTRLWPYGAEHITMYARATSCVSRFAGLKEPHIHNSMWIRRVLLSWMHAALTSWH